MSEIKKIVDVFENTDVSDFPDFYNYKKPLEMGLWVLWIAKEKSGFKKLTAEQIAIIIREDREISITAKSISKAFSRAQDKLYTHHTGKKASFEIMKPGKDHLISLVGKGFTEVFYFEPDKRYTSKKVLSKKILGILKDELRIVDPYCGKRTLDALGDTKNKTIKFLTRTRNLKQKEKNQFLRELQDFKLENPSIEFRDYPHSDIHDRYIISSKLLVILGHSIKDLGSKESFAVVLRRESSKNIAEALIENFNRRWKRANVL